MESVCAGNRTMGSNPILSAMSFYLIHIFQKSGFFIVHLVYIYMICLYGLNLEKYKEKEKNGYKILY